MLNKETSATVDLAKKNNVSLIIHNRQYEHSVHLGSYNYELPNSFCSLQLCVSAYNPDQYKKSLLINGLAALGDSLHPLQFLFLFLFPVSDWPAHGGCTLGCRAKHPQSLPTSPNTGAARHRPDGTAAATTVF